MKIDNDVNKVNESKNFLKRALITWCVGTRCDSQCRLFHCEIAIRDCFLVTLFVLFY